VCVSPVTRIAGIGHTPKSFAKHYFSIVRAITKETRPDPESMGMQYITSPTRLRPCAPPASRAIRSLRQYRRPLRLACFFLACLAPTLASAAPQAYYIHFQASPSESVVGYTIHLGQASRDYELNLDIGHPATSENEILYNATIENSVDSYLAVSSYDAFGNSSVYSNEIVVAAVVVEPPPPPAPEPEPTPDPEPEPSPDPDPEPTPDPEPAPEPQPGIVGSRLGVASDTSGLISTILEDGTLAYLTLDSLAAGQDLRPDRCDLDGDGDSDLVLGFGTGSAGQVALVYLENDVTVSVDSIQVGDAAYHTADGQTYPACGDVDGDGRVELVIGMGEAAEEHLQVLDDFASGFAPYPLNSSADGLLAVPTTTRIANLGAALTPALGDIDGDGRDELVVGFARQGIRHIAILDDALSEFGAHPNVTPNLPLVRVAKNSDVDTRGGATYPALGDWDGDGMDEIAVGFGTNSDGWVAFLDDAYAREYDRYAGFLMIPTGRPEYRTGEGSTRPAFGDIDGDGKDELIVGFGPGGSHELQIFDDMLTGGIDIVFGGMGFVSSPDPNAHWVAAPVR